MRVGVLLRGLVWSLFLHFAACDGANRQVVEICEKGCDCQSGLPAQRDACFDECLGEIGDLPEGFALPEECFECIQGASCVELGPCFDLCRGEDPEEDF